jgi:hypothetical protein
MFKLDPSKTVRLSGEREEDLKSKENFPFSKSERGQCGIGIGIEILER